MFGVFFDRDNGINHGCSQFFGQIIHVIAKGNPQRLNRRKINLDASVSFDGDTPAPESESDVSVPQKHCADQDG